MMEMPGLNYREPPLFQRWNFIKVAQEERTWKGVLESVCGVFKKIKIPENGTLTGKIA